MITIKFNVSNWKALLTIFGNLPLHSKAALSLPLTEAHNETSSRIAMEHFNNNFPRIGDTTSVYDAGTGARRGNSCLNRTSGDEVGRNYHSTHTDAPRSMFSPVNAHLHGGKKACMSRVYICILHLMKRIWSMLDADNSG